MRVLLTGATGFIGRKVAEVLSASGHEVVGISRSSSCSAVCATLGNDDFIEHVVGQVERCEAIVHAAACITYKNSDPDVIRVNCLGTQQILTIAEQWKSSTLVYTSSLPLIGLPLTRPITEAHVTLPRTAYHASKLFGEHLLSAAAPTDLACASLRLTAPVGSGMPDNRALSTFVRAARENQSISLAGQGGRVQNYVDVRDIANAIATCLARRPRGVFNLAGAKSLSNLDLAQACIRTLGSRSAIEFSSAPDPAENEVWEVSIEAARQAFGYAPRHDIESSILAVAEHYERRID